MKTVRKVGAIVALSVVLSIGIALYCSGRQGQNKVKGQAIEALQEVAVRVINRETEGLPYSVRRGGTMGKKYTKRRLITAEGDFEIQIDSLKEAHALFPLESNTATASSLLDGRQQFPLEDIREEWAKAMEAEVAAGAYALQLEVHPLGRDSVRNAFAGERVLCVPPHRLGSYYLDGMYTMTLHAYLCVGFWASVGWTSPLLMAVYLFCLLLLAGFGGWARRFLHRPVPCGLDQSAPPASVYTFGNSSFDVRSRMLICNGVEIPNLSQQPAKLLSAFLQAEDHFLYNDEIAAICGWSLEDAGLKERRKVAISSLRKLLAPDAQVEIKSLVHKKGYQMLYPGASGCESSVWNYLYSLLFGG